MSVAKMIMAILWRLTVKQICCKGSSTLTSILSLS